MKEPTRAPFYACMYHGLCDTARKHGYALAIHGSVVTDLDLIAVPWTDSAVSAEELRDALIRHINRCDADGDTSGDTMEIKPHGRMAWNLYLDHGAKVDLSVMPRLQAAPADKQQGAGTL